MSLPIKYEKKKGRVFFLPKSLLKKSCKATLCDDLNHASKISDLKGFFFPPAHSTLKMRSFTWLTVSRTFTAPGGRGRLPGQSTKWDKWQRTANRKHKYLYIFNSVNLEMELISVDTSEFL